MGRCCQGGCRRRIISPRTRDQHREDLAGPAGRGPQEALGAGQDRFRARARPGRRKRRNPGQVPGGLRGPAGRPGPVPNVGSGHPPVFDSGEQPSEFVARYWPMAAVAGVARSWRFSPLSATWCRRQSTLALTRLWRRAWLPQTLCSGPCLGRSASSRRTGSSSHSPKAGLWGPDDGRLSRPVLRAAGGEIPCATNEGGCREVVRQRSSVLHERWRMSGPPEPPCGGRLQTACMLR